MNLNKALLSSIHDLTAWIVKIFNLLLEWLYSQELKPLLRTIFFSTTVIFIILTSNFLYNEERNMVYTIKEHARPREIYQQYLPKSRLVRSRSLVSPGILIKNTTEFQLPKGCSNINSSIWKTCDAERSLFHDRTPNWTYPRFTVTGEKTEGFINRVLEIAWGRNPPSIDLYWRTGCHGIMQMKYLLRSIEIFSN